MKRRFAALAAACCLALAGCQGSQTSRVPTDYKAVLPYQTSDTRAKHVGLLSDEDVRFETERGLMDLSRQYFPPTDVAFKSHQFLDFSELDATDGSRGLLGTLRDDNPNGLNPNNNEAFDTGNGTVQGGVILVDIYELDWYKGESLAGISLALVVNDTITQNGQDYHINDEQMRSYIEVTSNKLVSYMRERFNEVTTRIPILVAAYELDSSDSSSSGGYIMEGWYGSGSSSGRFESVKETTLTVPSASFTEKAPELAAQFSAFQEDIRTVLADNTYVTGECRFLNDEPDRLNLTVTTHGKTLSEVIAASQACQEKIGTFTDTDVEYYITILNNDTPYAIGHRVKDADTLEMITIQ